MALFLFTRAILENKPIKVFNHGDLERDFTYIDDIVEGVVRVIDRIPSANPEWDGRKPDPSSSPAPYRLYNIGNNNPTRLMDFIGTIEKTLDKKAKKDFFPMQPGDVHSTYADVDDLAEDTGFRPDTPLDEGIRRFIEWYREYYGIR
jgi:UDP-glucuronate 4-epimerase